MCMCMHMYTHTHTKNKEQFSVESFILNLGYPSLCLLPYLGRLAKYVLDVFKENEEI